MRPTASLFRSLSSRAFAVALLGTTFLAACGGGDDNGPSNPTPPDTGNGQTLFAMENLSSQDAYYVYIRACGTQSWGSDRLGATRVLDVGEVISWTVNTPGCYDVRANTDLNGGEQALYPGVNIVAGQTTTVTIRDSNWE